MREVKFRGKSLLTGKWEYGSYVGILNPHRSEYHIIEAFINGGLRNLSTHIAVDPDSVGQYTGQKDVNGKEVYEGDIYKTDGGIFQVVFSYSAFCGGKNIANCAPLGWQVNDRRDDLKEEDITDVIEVIGNTHDNPELLK